MSYRFRSLTAFVPLAALPLFFAPLGHAADAPATTVALRQRRRERRDHRGRRRQGRGRGPHPGRQASARHQAVARRQAALRRALRLAARRARRRRVEAAPGDRTADGIGVVDSRPASWSARESGQDPESFDLSRDGKTLYVSNEETAEMTRARRRARQGHPQGRGRRRAGGGHAAPRRQGASTSPPRRTTRSPPSTPASCKVLARIPTGPRPRAIVFTPDGKTAFVTCENGARGDRHRRGQERRRRHIKIEPVAKTSSARGRWALALSPDGKTLYVSIGRGEAVAVIDVATRKVARLIDGVGARPWGIARQRRRQEALHRQRPVQRRLGRRRSPPAPSKSGSRSADSPGACCSPPSR